MSRFLRKRLQGFQSYTPGEQPKDMAYVKLNTNESPFPPAPGVVAALKQADLEKLQLYPDPTGSRLKEKIANLYGVEKENVFLSNGSDDILNFAFLALNEEGDKLAMPDITYSFYEVIAKLHGLTCDSKPLTKELTIDSKDYIGIHENIVLPNPNAPTGMVLPLATLEEIVASNPDNIVLIDEAYVDFGAESCVPLVKKYDNLIVSQTFSKSRSFAGGRLGFAVADKALIGDLSTIQFATNPYNVNTLSLLLAQAAIQEDGYYKENALRIAAIREKTVARLEDLGFAVLPSRANFVFAKHRAMSGERVYHGLKEKGVLVRHFDAERIKDYCRITIGSEAQMDILFQKLEELLEEQREVQR